MGTDLQPFQFLRNLRLVISIKTWHKKLPVHIRFREGCTVWGLRCESAASLVSSTLVTPPIWPEPEGLEPLILWLSPISACSNNSTNKTVCCSRTWFLGLRTKSYKIAKVGFILKGAHDQVCLHFFRWIRRWLCLLLLPGQPKMKEKHGNTSRNRRWTEWPLGCAVFYWSAMDGWASTARLA